MRRYKPLNLLNDKGFWPEKIALVDAIKEVLTIGKCTRPLPVHDYGRYRDREWRNAEDELVPYRSVDWYVSDSMDEDRMQVDSLHLLNAFAEEPWRKDELLGDHYDLFVIQEDMFGSPERAEPGDSDYVVGRAQPLTAAVISTHRIEHIWGMPYSYLKTEVMRQLCFMFGVPETGRGDVVELGGECYCQNICILRPARNAPEDWQRLTQDRLEHGALCQACTTDLRAFFRRVAAEATD